MGRSIAAPARIESGLFHRLRWQLLRNTTRAAVSGSALRVALIIVCSVLIWGGIFAISAETFHFLIRQRITLVGGIVGTVFDLMFLALTILLLFSSGILLYSSLFAAPEAAFLLSTPVAADWVFAHKFQGAVGFSSWAFLLLGSPVLIAYGLAFGAPWLFYPLLLLFFVGFILLPGALGALACLLIVNFVPKRRTQVAAVAAIVVFAVVAFWLYQLRPTHWSDVFQRDYMQRLLGQLAVGQGAIAPTHWLSRGIQASARGDLARSLYYLGLVWSNGLFLYVLLTWAAKRLYRRGYNRLKTGGSLRRKYGGLWLDRALSASVAFLDTQTRLLIIKDFRAFRRDPAQWAQVLIFTGLMVLYFANMRRFYQEDLGRPYQNGISLMNLAATALLLCAYTGRFIYPMLSLEGKKFWILGLLPMRRERLLWGKFAFSATWALLIAEFLVLFSDFMLGMPPIILIVHFIAVIVLALGLSGLSIGLGAAMPNFRETDPSKIAVGFGGTLNLIVSLLFLLVTVVLLTGPWHMRVAWENPQDGTSFSVLWPLASSALGLGVGAAAVFLPLRLGARSLQRMEF